VGGANLKERLMRNRDMHKIIANLRLEIESWERENVERGKLIETMSKMINACRGQIPNETVAMLDAEMNLYKNRCNIFGDEYIERLKLGEERKVIKRLSKVGFNNSPRQFVN
jgi:hypothetical protein